MYIKSQFKKIKDIIPVIGGSTTADSTTMSSTNALYSFAPNKNITLRVTSGIFYINPSTTATAANGLVMSTGEGLSTLNLLMPSNPISAFSTDTNSRMQAIIWEEG